MSEIHESLLQWGTFYVTRRRWKLIPIHVLINGRCSCGKFPCGDVKSPDAPWGSNAGKHPATMQWSNPALAISTAEDVQRTWGNAQNLPYSIGLLCGQPSGVVALDVDPRNGGLESLQELEDNIHIPYTLKGVSGGGGFHIYFKAPPGERLTKGALHADLPGLDWQSDGSQILVPPSSHASGNRYRWADGMTGAEPIAEMPDDLLRLARGSRGGAQGGAGTQISIDALIAKGRITEGSRNGTLKSGALSLARKLNATDAATQLIVINTMKQINQQICDPPLSDGEIEAMCRTAFQRLADDPTGRLDPAIADWVEQQRAQQQPAAAPVASTTTGTADQAGGAAAPGGASPGGQTASDGPGADDPDDPQAPGSGGGGNAAPLPPDPDSLGPDGTPGMRSLSENGNARRLVDYFENEIRYTPAGGWYRWSGTYWMSDMEALSVTELARHLAVNIVSEIPNWPQTAQTDVATWAVRSRDQGRIKKAVALAVTDPRIIVPPNNWDADPHLLGVRNGVIDLRTGQLIPPRRDQYITKRTAIEYVPGLRDTRWEVFLEQVTGGDKELQAWLQRVIGYTLTGLTIEEKFFLVYGPPASGKSTILEVVKALLGDYGLTLLAENIMQQRGGGSSGADMYFNAEIMGRRMVAVSELPESEKMKEDAVKRLTGADTMMGRKIAQQPVQFTSNAKLWVATNHRPRVADPGIWRRMRAIPFMYQPPALDKTLKPYLMDPNGGLPGIMSWAVEGAVRWYAAGTIGNARVVDEATSEYREAEDEMGQFLKEETRPNAGGSVTLGDLFNSYRAWMADRGLENYGNVGKFQRSLVDRGLDLEGSGRRAMVNGVAIVPRAVESVQSGGGLASLYERARGL